MQTYQVLIVEDDPMVAMINEQYVCKNKNFSVAGSVRNGQEALDFLETNNVDLLVLDVFMPVLNGTDTLKQIRKKNIPVEVIMVTAANDTSTLEDTMHLGVIDYLIKPFAFDRFQIALEKFSSKVSALKNNSVLDQNFIDSIISNSSQQIKNVDEKYPKGIQQKTLSMIMNYFEKNTGYHSGDMIAEKLGISIVTVRHYMNYLVKQNKIHEDVNYGTGGRPSMVYKKK